jgi:aconitate hydratase
MTANSFGSRAVLRLADQECVIYRLDAVTGSQTLPSSLKILLENLLRNEDGVNVTAAQARAVAGWDPAAEPGTEIQFTPARVLLQDLTGVPAVVDLAAMREAMQALGGDPARINPLIPAELVIDHSVVADVFGRPDAFARNAAIEFDRNRERFRGIAEINTGIIPNGVCVTADGTEFHVVVRIDTPGEADYYRHGGIMPYVLRSLL